jgi:type I restriction enzyme S subunit
MMFNRQSEFESLWHGSTGQTELRRDRLSALQIIVPLQKLQQIYDEPGNKLFGLIKTNELQSASLYTVRDTLLPKLISGELRVPDVVTILVKLS